MDTYPLQKNSERSPSASGPGPISDDSAFFSRRIALVAVVCLGVVTGFSLNVLSSLAFRWLVGSVGALFFLTLAAIAGRIRFLLLPLLTFTAGLGIGAHVVYVPDHSGVASGITIDISDLSLVMLYGQWFHAAFYHRRSKVVYFKSISIPFLGLLAAAALSLWKSNYLALSAYGIIDYVKSYAFFFYLANTVRRSEDLDLVFKGLQLNLVFLGSVCIAEAMLGVNFNSSFDMIFPSEWEEYEGLAFRAGGLSTPTYTGGYLASMLPLLMAYFILKREPAGRTLCAAALLFGAIGLLLSLTRTAFVSLAFGSFLVLSCATLKRFIRIRFAVVPLIILVILGVANSDRILSRLDEGGGNLVARHGLIMVASSMIIDNPLLGVGINTYHEAMDAYTPNSLPHEFRYVVHNKFLLLWAEMGTIGLLSFLIIWVVAVAQASKVLRSNDRRNAILGIGLFGALSVFSINMNLEAYAGGALMYPFWLVIALVAALNGPLYKPAVPSSDRKLTHPPAAGMAQVKDLRNLGTH